MGRSLKYLCSGEKQKKKKVKITKKKDSSIHRAHDVCRGCRFGSVGLIGSDGFGENSSTCLIGVRVVIKLEWCP